MPRFSRFFAILAHAALASAALGADQSPPAGHLITLEVAIVELAEPPEPGGPLDAEATARLISRIQELDAKGQLAGATRVRLSTLENLPALAQIGEQAPVVSGRTFGPGRRGETTFTSVPNFSTQQYGTVVNATARMEEAGTILIEVQIEKTAPGRESSANAADGQAADAVAPPRLVTTQARSTVRVANGQTSIVQRTSVPAGSAARQTVILLTARADAAAGAPHRAADRPDSEVRIFALKHALASEMAGGITSLFNKKALRIAVDRRTNSIIASGPRDDLAILEAVLLRLDEQPSSPATEPASGSR